MGARHHILPPIIWGSLALLIVLAITVGWNLLFAFYYQATVDEATSTAARVGFWMLMATGDLALVLVMVVVLLLIFNSVRRARQLRYQDTFIDRVTHELKTPLAAIRLALDTWQRRNLTGDQLIAQRTGMRRDLDRLQALIDHVIEAGRLEHGERDLRPAPVDLVAVVDHASERACQRHARAGSHIHRDYAAAPKQVHSDPVAVESIVVNLLDNALKYGGDEPVQVSLVASDEHWELQVRDHGIGLPASDLRRIFRRFYRVKSAETRRRPGTGLGLYIVGSLVRQLGGKVVAHSPGPGRGTTITVTMPNRSAVTTIEEGP